LFRVSILDIEKAQPIFADMASSVVLPGEEGELSILDFHQPIVCCLKEGTIRVDEKELGPIKTGIAGMRGNELSVLVQK